MSAEGPRGKPRKRSKDEIYRHIEDTDMEPSRAVRMLRRELPWKDWFLTDFLRYWYWLGGLALDIFLTLELARRYHVRDAVGILLLAVIFFAIAGVAFWGYRLIWPEGPFTRTEAQRKAIRKMMKRRRFT